MCDLLPPRTSHFFDKFDDSTVKFCRPSLCSPLLSLLSLFSWPMMLKKKKDLYALFIQISFKVINGTYRTEKDKKYML